MTPDLSRRLGRALGGHVVTLVERGRVIAALGQSVENWDDLPADVRALVEEIEARPGPTAAAARRAPHRSVPTDFDTAALRIRGIVRGSTDGRRSSDDIDDEETLALIVALDELSAEYEGRAWDPARHPRNPPGAPGGGRFRSMVNRLKDAITAHVNGNGEGHPFDGFDREQLRKAAKARGITLARGEDRDSIAQKLLDSLRGETGTQEIPAAAPPHPAPPHPAAAQPRTPRITARQRAAAAGRAATVASLTEEQLWREHTDTGRRRVAADIAAAHWWRDDWDGAAELRAALRRYGRGEGPVGSLRRVGADIEARHNLRAERRPGELVLYDPATMEPSTNFAQDGLHPLVPGDPAEVTAPGYRYTGGRVETQAVRARARPVGGAAVTQRPRPASGPQHARPATRPARPAGPAKLMLDSETDVPPAATLFDRAAAAHADASFWEEHPVDPRPFQQILSGDMAGLRVYGMEVNYGQTAGGGDVLRMQGRLERHDGRDVGTFTVTFKRDTEGKITAYHDYLDLQRSQQGSGFANEYGLRLLTWYRESGVNEMTLHADIDVGGYAWARMGFNWTNAAEASNIGGRLAEIVGTAIPRVRFRGAPNPDEQVALGRELLARMRRARTLQEYPTPYEISQLGRWPGAGRDDMWVGKALLLGSSWHGRLTLSEVNR